MDAAIRLYLDDPYRLEFEATVLETRRLDADAVGLVLDKSAFYPTSGGQPYDTGTLDGEPVQDVFEAADGVVVHRVRRAPAGPVVRGQVDGARRRDHMQQHSGQHLLSATFLTVCDRPTASFHLGDERCTIDLPGATFDASTLAAVELAANAIIWEARPVRTRFLDAAGAARLRQPPPEGVGPVRIVEIEGWDENACCGTHVRSTAEIGVIKLLGQEKLAQGTRIAFACGRRALVVCGAAQSRLDALVRLLTCHPDELAERCEKLMQENRALRKDAEALGAEVARGRAAGLASAAPRLGGIPVVVEEIAGGATVLPELATALVQAGAVALLGARDDRARLLFARPDGVDLDLRPVLTRALAMVDGKGGGPPARVQGAGSRPDAVPGALAAALEAVRERLAQTTFDTSSDDR